jgi:arylsulfatase A-like enzyme
LADHGEGFGEHDDAFVHGGNLFEPSLHVPFPIRRNGPRSPPAPSRLQPSARWSS